MQTVNLVTTSSILFSKWNRPMFTKDFIAAELAIKTLKTLPKGLRKKVKKNILLHSDQCSQYTSKEFTDFCKAAGITQNMSKAGYPYDNAPMKRYFNSLKNELIYFYHYRTEEALYSAVENYAYVYYNNMRPHSANNHLTPFEKRYEKLGHAVTKLLNQNNNTNIDLIFF